MKTKTIVAILLAVLFVSCQTNNPENSQTQENKTSIPGLRVKEHIPITEWLNNSEESVIHYSFVDYPSGTCTKKVHNLSEGANTIMLNDKFGIRFQDSCAVDNSNGKYICHFFGKCEVIDKENEDLSHNQISRMPSRDLYDDYFSFDFTTSGVDPINIIRPLPTTCNPIPMCYYHLMDVEWNPDSQNPTQMMIVTEWNGLNMDGTSVDTTIIHHMETDDDGIVTLDDNIFNDMPDGALVNIWLARENIVTIYYDEEPITIDYLLRKIENNPASLTVLTYNHPELYFQLHSVHFVFGAIAHLPIFLIRKSVDEITERKTPIYQ